MLRGAGHGACSAQVYRDSGGQACGESIHRPGRTISRGELGEEPVRDVVRMDNVSRYKAVAFMAKTSDATAAVRVIIATYFAPAGLNIGIL